MTTSIKTENEKEKKLISELDIGTRSETVKNPFSEEIAVLCPEAVALYDFIKGAELLEDDDGLRTGLDIFRNNWPDAYMKLLD